MRKTLLLTILATGLWLLASGNAQANNLSIENVEVREIDTTNKTAIIRFDISWENSWRDTVNYDAVWVFAKYKNSDGVWNHVLLSGSGTDPSGYSLGDDGDTAASGNMDNIEIVVPEDKVGCFIQRSENETGTLDRDKIEMLWNYDAAGLEETDLEDTGLQVFAIEMVYIPQSAFYIGDGSTTTIQGFFEDGTTGGVLQILSEDALVLGGGASGSVGNNNATGMVSADDFNDTTSKTLPVTFPKGYNAFYSMKYEVTQRQYADFLNALSTAQKTMRTAAMTALQYVMTNTASVTSRNGLYTPDGVTVVCDFDDDGVGYESTDGQWIACSYLSWMDLAAFLDWTGLRPMTEMEFEKICRGPDVPVSDEFPWATLSYNRATGIIDSGLINESPTPTGAGITNFKQGTSVGGPMRVGFQATDSSTRITGASSYYGVMNMGDNVVERTVSVGNSTGRLFTGTHGDGMLTTTTSYEGNATNLDWPGISATIAQGVTGATGSGSRGSSNDADEQSMRVSDRENASTTNTSRTTATGGRGVRTA